MPNQGVPVIFKNKIAYGYAEKSVQAYDVSVSDYNALTEQQQLDGSIRFIQGVDAIPNGSNVWAKLGTTPLAEGLPRDCSQAVNQLKSNLTDLQVYSTTEKVVGTWTDGRPIYRKTYSGNAVKSGNVTLDTINTLDLIVGSFGSAVSDYNWRWTIPNGDTSGYANRLRFSTSTKQLQLYFDSNYNTSCTFNITVDYVKSV